MGAPVGDDDDDDLVRIGRGDDDDDLDEEEEEEDPEEEELEEDPEEEELEEDPEEEEEEIGEVAAGEEAEQLEEDGGGGEELHGEEEEVVEEQEDELEEVEEEEVEEEEEEEEEADEIEEDEKEDDLGTGNNEENKDEVVKDDKPSVPSIAFETEDTTDRLPGAGETQFGVMTDTDGPGNESGDTEDIQPLIFTKAKLLKNENMDCASKGEGVYELDSDCGKKDTRQHANEKYAKDIDFCAMRGELRGFEAAELPFTNPSILVEPGAARYDKVDCGSEGDRVKEMESDGEREICQDINKKDAKNIDGCAHLVSEVKGVKRMEFDCKEKERYINKNGAESIDVYAPSSESKGTAEITKPLSTAGLDSELFLMQEGGVEDMELDSEENIVHGSDVDGTVVDSIQENIALNSHHEAFFITGADALINTTVVAGSLKSSSSGGEDTTHSRELKLGEGKTMILGLKEHAPPKPSSMVAALGKQRSLSPVTQLMGNKRPAIICNYYAKGWCIKGNSCRFLHVKENKDNTNKQQERNLASANGENQVSEGVGDSTKTIFPEQHAESHRQQLNNKLGYSSFESRLLHSAKPEFGCGVVASSSAFASRLRPSNVNATVADHKRSQHMFNDPLQSIANRYINQYLHPSEATDMYSSRYISPINGFSNSRISLNSNPFDARKILSGSTDFHASSSSLEQICQRDPLNSPGLARKDELYKWEPSRPFRPSYHFSIPSASSPDSMYDPLRDCIDPSSLGIGSFKAELIHYPSHQRYLDSPSAGNHFEINGYNGTKLDRYGQSRVTELPVTEAEAAESSVANQGNLGSAPGGDKGSGTSNGKDLSETNETNTVSAETKRLIEEKIHSNGVDVRGLAENEQRESKTFRQFRVALVEFIKELLKPAWRLGNLSKNAHNLIVKKAMNKVLSSLHSHLVPSTPESVEQYLSASQSKITKLLEAYVQKHNKT